MYEDVLWRKMRSRPECKDLKSSLLFLEIFSYIKGSAEALRTEQGFLSETNYKQVQNPCTQTRTLGKFKTKFENFVLCADEVMRVIWIAVREEEGSRIQQ